MSLVVVLGAGFSKAVCENFPLTDELGDRVVKLLQSEGHSVQRPLPYHGKKFEAWLSRLAEPQPDLAEADNLRNSELFTRITGAIHRVISEQQQSMGGAAFPWWLYRLIGCLHYLGATVITFNYDTLFETALQSSGLSSSDAPPNSTRVTVEAALRDMPLRAEEPAGGLISHTPSSQALRLIKLHGSIDTFWIRGDESGSTIRRWTGSETRRHELLPGREPFIVPPSAAKTPFYRNPLTRQLWADASASLNEASRVALIGYSLPETDLVAAGMFGERLSENGSVVSVVNPDYDGPKKNLVELGIAEDRLSCVEQVEEYVTVLEEQLPEVAFPKMPHVQSSSPVQISRGKVRALAVRDAHRDLAGEVIIRASGIEDTTVGLRAETLQAHLSQSGRLWIKFEDGCYSPVAAISPGLYGGEAPRPVLLHPTAIPQAFKGLPR